jgi:RHH-type rel operon transcriptional repressor/antitoxin RelB
MHVDVSQRTGLAVPMQGCVHQPRAEPAKDTPWIDAQGVVLGCVHSNTALDLSMSTTMTIRLDDEVKERLDHLADATHRSKSFLAAEAIRAYVETNEWQIGEVRAALKEADAEDFASDKEVAAVARKWKVNAN